MVKRIAQIILPKFDNSGASLTWSHANFQRKFCEAFGGFTAYDVRGGWIDHAGKLYQDESVSFHIAMDDNSATASALRAIAMEAATELKQEAIFIVYASGIVDFIYPAKEA